MGGDLNLKKSWHPVLMSNQRRVWEEEKKALDERKRTEQRIKELKEERAKEEIQAKLEAAGSRKRIDRVDWMYQGPSSGQGGTTEEMEGYLLGKRRIDGLIKGTEHKKLEKQASQDSFMALQNANTLRDTAAKIREDPMLAIKKQEQAAYEAMMNDPIKRRQLLAAIGGVEEKKPKDKERKHRHHHRRRHNDSDDERRHKRRRTDNDNGDYRGSLAYHRRHASGHGRSLSRSMSPRRDRQSRDSRSISPFRRSRDDSYAREDYSRRNGSRRARSRSYSSRSRSLSPSRRRQSFPDGRKETDTRRNDDSHYDHFPDKRDSYRQDESSRSRQDKLQNDEDERQRKLAAMQQDASMLDLDREKRLAAIAEKEKADREADEKSRVISSKYGDRADFVNSMHRKAGDMSLADRIGRSRQGLQRED